MNKKDVAKKYLISVLALYFFGVLFLSLFLTALSHAGYNSLMGIEISIVNALLLSAVISLVPAGSFTGFVVSGLKIKEISTKKATLLIVFFPLVLAFVTVFGIIMVIPSIIKAFITLIRS